jgi:hypothetical protein
MIDVTPDLWDVAVGVTSFTVGALLASIGADRRNPVKWELDTRPTDKGVALYAVKGKKETCLHRIAYNRSVAAREDERHKDFDEAFAEALARSRTVIQSLNAADREG